MYCSFKIFTYSSLRTILIVGIPNISQTRIIILPSWLHAAVYTIAYAPRIWALSVRPIAVKGLTKYIEPLVKDMFAGKGTQLIIVAITYYSKQPPVNISFLGVTFLVNATLLPRRALPIGL